ncbi:828_t:CDS:1, partial [Gigaspora rosea]
NDKNNSSTNEIDIVEVLRKHELYYEFRVEVVIENIIEDESIQRIKDRLDELEKNAKKIFIK